MYTTWGWIPCVMELDGDWNPSAGHLQQQISRPHPPQLEQILVWRKVWDLTNRPPKGSWRGREIPFYFWEIYRLVKKFMWEDSWSWIETEVPVENEVPRFLVTMPPPLVWLASFVANWHQSPELFWPLWPVNWQPKYATSHDKRATQGKPLKLHRNKWHDSKGCFQRTRYYLFRKDWSNLGTSPVERTAKSCKRLKKDQWWLGLTYHCLPQNYLCYIYSRWLCFHLFLNIS